MSWLSGCEMNWHWYGHGFTWWT